MKLVFALLTFAVIAIGCTKKEAAAPAPAETPAAAPVAEAAPAAADTTTPSTTLAQ